MLDCVTREAIVQADPAEVWAALTDADRVAQWFGDTAEIDLRVGGAVRFTWPAGEVSKGVVTALEPLMTFAFRWDVFGTIVDPAAFTLVEFRLRAVEGGTAVRIMETGLAGLIDEGAATDIEELFEEHVDGWRNEMSDLVQHVESGRPAPAPAPAVDPALDPAVEPSVEPAVDLAAGPATGPGSTAGQPVTELPSPTSELPA